MKIQIPADMNPEYVDYYVLSYWVGWNDYRKLGHKDLDLREVAPDGYDAGFSASIQASINWKRKK